MQPPFTLILGTLGIAAALVAAPVGLQDNATSFYEKAAIAAGNGGGNGGGNGASNGRGGGRGHGQGNGGGQGLGQNMSVSADPPGKSGSAPGHSETSNGQAFGHDAVSGVPSHSAHQNGTSLEGNLKAANAAPQAFENSASNSMVGAIATAVRESYVSSGDEDTVIDRDEIDLDALEAALVGIRNKDVDADDAIAAAGAGDDGYSDVANAVAGEVDGKVGEPDPVGP